MTEKKFLDQGGLSHLWDKIKSYITTNINTRVPTSRTVNGKALSSNISLNYFDVDAASSGHNHDRRYIYTEVEVFQSSNSRIVTLPTLFIGEMRLVSVNATGYNEAYVKLPAGGYYSVFGITSSNVYYTKVGKYSGGSLLVSDINDEGNASVLLLGFYMRIS